ncbi:hypothetical protein DPMN_151527 [Dreissena polymorpha]|uniref:NACHT domain-containing protein n=1 Tax=Dreissena polymorpha TaxID=45954 RepID=A0A9D4FGM9_DREPO|nr:hypothetical protein DPMN_151527 [Dreissena polymorpha]
MANFNDKQTLQEYEFVFLVTLRDSPTQMELLHMIEEQIIDNIYGDLDREKVYTLLQIVMQKEPCLLIQDGLDEWYYSNGKSLLPLLPTSYNHCTKLITTRPWKLENSIKDSFVGSLLEISGVNQYMLANYILVSFARKHTKDVKCEFKEYIDKDHLKQFVKVPMMLTIIVCMWVDGMCFTGTVCQIYSTLLESLLAKVTNKSEYFNDSPVFCLKNTQFIKPNIEFVKAIANVAFHSLFSLEREKSLVFSEMELYQYLQHHVDKEEIKSIALNAGILSLRRSSSFINRSSTSFVHKSMQEFLAAYYIAENMNVIDEEMCGFVIKFEIDVFKYLCGLNINAANKLTCVLYDTVARIDTSQPHFCTSRTFQNILISGYKEAIANGIDESQICLKISHIYYDRSISCKADFEILTCILKANILKVRFLFIWGDSLCQHLSEETIDISLLSVKAAYYRNAFLIGGDSLCKLVSEKMKDNTDSSCKLVSEETKDNTVYAANGMYNVNKGTFELCDLSPCTNLGGIHLNGHMVVLPKALYNLKNLKHITKPKYCKVVGCLDLSASLLLETVDRRYRRGVSNYSTWKHENYKI